MMDEAVVSVLDLSFLLTEKFDTRATDQDITLSFNNFEDVELMLQRLSIFKPEYDLDF